MSQARPALNAVKATVLGVTDRRDGGFWITVRIGRERALVKAERRHAVGASVRVLGEGAARRIDEAGYA